jgi:F420-dependent oxidoreductase-like protein
VSCDDAAVEIGIFGFESTVSGLTASVRTARDQGFGSYWMAQLFGLDALTALAVVATEVDGIGLGTSVVPTYPRHPMVLAQQALTVNQVSGGRLTLGIGLSHQPVVEGMWGLPFDRPVRHMTDYLEILMPLLAGERISYTGEAVTGHGQVEVAAEPCPVVVAALGPRMLELAGRRTDGTLTWMVGPRTLAEHTVPAITAAAESAGRGAPQVIVGVPVCVTDDPTGALQRAGTAYAIYGQLPSYRAMLDREGVEAPEEIAVIGGGAEVGERLHGLVEAGATLVAASEFGTAGEREATREVLVGLLG